MKKTLFILLLTMFAGTTFAQQSPCAYTYSAPSTTATFTHGWTIIMTQNVDSIRLDYGDGSPSVLFTAPIPMNSNHTYPGGGWYNTCLTRYISSLTQPNVVITCTFCDSVFIPGPPAPCTTTLAPLVAGNGSISTSASSTGGSGPYSYSYTLNPGNVTNSTGTFSGLNPGSYTICVTGFDAQQNLCSTDCDSVFVNNNQTPCTTLVAATSIANTLNAVAIASFGTPPYTYSYTLNPGSITNTTGVFTGLAFGIHTVCATATDALNQTCTSACDTLGVGISFVCNTTLALSTAPNTINATASTTGGTAPYTYTFTLTPGNITNTTGVFTGLSNGSYAVCVTSNDAFQNLCSTDCDTISLNNTSSGCTTTISTTTGNSSLTASAASTGGVAPYTHSYTLNPGNVTNTTGIFTGLASGTYTVCAVGIDANADTCTTACDSAFVSNNTPGGCIATANYGVSINGLTVTLTNSSTCTGCAAPMTYFWQFGDGATSTLANPTHTYALPNTYTICLDVNGFDSLQTSCSDSLCDNYMVGASSVNNFSKNALNIYPNPTNGNFTIEVPEGEKAKGVIIEDITGRKIISRQYSNSLSGKLVFDLKNNAGGIYFIKLQTDRQLYTSTILNQE